MRKTISIILVMAMLINIAFSGIITSATEDVISIQAENNVESQTDREKAESKVGEESHDKAEMQMAKSDLQRSAKDVLADNTLIDFKRTNLHKGEELLDGGEIDLAFPIDINLRFRMPVKGDYLNGEGYDEGKTVHKGDYAEIDLGNKIKFKGEQRQELRGNIMLEDGNRILIGHAKLEERADHTWVRIDFDGEDKVFDGSLHDVFVEAVVRVEVKEEWIPEGNGASFEIFGIKLLTSTSKAIESISKGGELVTVDNNGVQVATPQIKWTVEVEVKNPKGEDADLGDYKIYDNILVDDEKANNPQKYKKVHSFTLNGQSIDGAYSEANGKLEYVFAAGTKGKQTFTYLTDLTAEEYYAFYTRHRANTAILLKKNKAGEYTEVKRKGRIVYLPGSEWILKRGRTYRNDAKEKQVLWTVEINKLKQILNNVRIKDVLPSGLAYNRAWLEHKVADKWTPVEPLANGEGKEIVPDSESVYTIGQVNENIRLVIIADVTANTDKLLTFNNRADVIIEQEAGDSVTLSAGWEISFGKEGLIKSSPKRIWADSSIKWELEVPSEVKNLIAAGESKVKVYDLLIHDGDITEDFLRNTANHPRISGLPSGIRIEDIMPSLMTHMEYQAGSFQTASQGVREAGVYPILLDGNTVIGKLVEFEIDTALINADGGWKFSFKAMPTAKNKAFIHRGQNAWMNNTAYLFYEGKRLFRAYNSTVYRPDVFQKRMLSIEGARKVKADLSDFDATSGVNAVSSDNRNGFDNKALAKAEEGAVIFRFDLNANGHPHLNDILGTVKLHDNLPNGWVFTPIGGQDFVVYEAQNKIVEETNTHHIYQQIESLTATRLLTKEEAKNKGFTVDAAYQDFIGKKDMKLDLTGALDKSYILLVAARPVEDKIRYYKDKLTEDVIEVNHGGLESIKTNKITGEKEYAKLISRQEIRFNLGVVSKVAKSLTGLVEWTVVVNPYNTSGNYKNIWLEDKLGEGMDLRVDDNGNVLVSDYKLEEKALTAGDWSEVDRANYRASYDKNSKTFQVTLPENTKSYRLIYNTEISALAASKVSNEVVVKGDGKIEGQVRQGYIVQEANAKVRYGINGSIEIVKRDQNGNAVTGAEFTLQSSLDAKKTSGMTSSTGTLIFHPIQPGSYILTETKVPDGYVAGEKETKTGYKVVVTEKMVNGKLTITTEIDDKEYARNQITVINTALPKPDNPVIPPYIPPYVPNLPEGDGDGKTNDESGQTPPTKGEENEEVPNTPIPEALPNIPETENTPLPEEGLEELEENPIPKGKTELPKTSGLPASMMILMGSLLAALGFGFKKEK